MTAGGKPGGQAGRAPKDDRQILILGCGFLGQVVAQRLAFRGTPVTGTTRTLEQVSVIRTRGAEAVLFDGTDLTPIVRAASRAKGIVMCIPPSSPSGTSAGAGAAVGDADDATLDKKLVDALGALPLESAVYISSTSVYGDKGGALTVEGDAVAPDSPKGRARVAAEDVWRSASFPTAVIRPAGIYGQGRSLLHRMAAGKYRLVDGGRAVTNRIHVADLASLVVRALERPPARGEAAATWLGSDLAPAPQAEVVAWISQLTGWPAPPEMSLAEARVRMDKDTLGMFVQSKRLDPAATLAALGVTLKYPSYREGLADIWLRERTALESRFLDRAVDLG